MRSTKKLLSRYGDQAAIARALANRRTEIERLQAEMETATPPNGPRRRHRGLQTPLNITIRSITSTISNGVGPSGRRAS